MKKLSRQRLYQIRHKELGLCSRDSRPVFKENMCELCYRKYIPRIRRSRRLAQRKYYGCKACYKSKWNPEGRWNSIKVFQ